MIGFAGKALSPREASANLTWLKLLAIIAMLWDHSVVAALQLWPAPAIETLLRTPGRIAMPVFAFLIAYGYEHFSTSRVHYALRLWLFALISEAAYIWLFDRVGNAFVPLAIGATILLFLDEARDRLTILFALALPWYFALITNEVPVLILPLLIWLFHRIIRTGDWLRWIAPVAIIVYLLNGWVAPYLAMIPVTLFLIALSIRQQLGLPAIRLNKYAAYGFYPAHLALLALVVHLLKAN